MYLRIRTTDQKAHVSNDVPLQEAIDDWRKCYVTSSTWTDDGITKNLVQSSADLLMNYSRAAYLKVEIGSETVYFNPANIVSVSIVNAYAST